MKELNELAKKIHQAHLHWWQDIHTGQPITRNKGELLALAISEVSEALNGERQGLMDDHLPHRRMAEVEMADTYIRLLDFAGGFGFVPYGGYDLQDLPENKGAGLLKIMKHICKCDNECEPIAVANLNFALGCVRAYCRKHGYDLEGAIEEKLAYNATRKDHTHEARKSDGGKKF